MAPLLPGLDALPTLPAQRLRLRALTPADTDDVFAVFADPLVMRYWSSPPMTSPDQAAGYIGQIRDWFASRGGLQWGIALDDDDDRIIGTVTLCAFALEHRRCEIGYALGADHWGQGYAGEALRRVLAFAFDELDLARIEADVDPRNEASIRLLERLRFQREGLLRARWRVAGEVQDALIYGLLREDHLDMGVLSGTIRRSQASA
jgi:RimJ/RimL family protein N-acetyltransferase